MKKGNSKGAIIMLLGLLFWSGACWAGEFSPRGASPPPRDLTFELIEIQARWEELSPEQKAYYGSFYLPYPVGSNFKGAMLWSLSDADYNISKANVVYTKHFRLIWGQDYKQYVKKDSPYYVLWGDSDGDGYPNFIEYLLGSDPNSSVSPYSGMDFSSGILEFVWKQIVDEWGFKSPPWSGNYYVDVYIGGTGVINPTLPTSTASYGIKLPDNVYGVTSVYQNGVPYIIINQNMGVSTLKVTFAHEFFHAVQLSYVPYEGLIQDTNKFLAESTATWMEDAVYPEINNYVQYVKYWLDYPEDSMFTGGFSDYGGVLFMKYITENFSPETDLLGIGIIKQLWQDTEQLGSPLQAISKFLKEQKIRPIHNLKDAYTEFAIKNLDIKNSYKDGAKYKDIYIVKSTTMDLDKYTIESFAMDLYGYAPSPYGANYVKLSWGATDTNYVLRLFSGFNFLYSYKKSEPDFRVYAVFEDDKGKKSDPIQFSFKDLKEGKLFKIMPAGLTACYLVIIGLPKDEFNFDSGEKYFYNLAYNAYHGKLEEGWNLVGLYQSTEKDWGWLEGKFVSMWKWDKQGSWFLLLPNVEEGLFNSYLASYGFKKLTGVQDGEGVWLNMSTEAAEPSEPFLESQTISLTPGWNLLGIRVASSYKPQEVLSDCNAKSMWVWASSNKTWQVYIPSLGEAIVDYVKSKGYQLLERVYSGDGFWVNSEGNCKINLSLN